jgi:hypothetical protein
MERSLTYIHACIHVWQERCRTYIHAYMHTYLAGAVYGAVTYQHPYRGHLHTYMAGAVPEVAYGGSKQRVPHNSSPPARPPKKSTHAQHASHAPPNNDALRAEGGPGGGGGGDREVSRSVYSEEEEGEPSLTDWKIEVFRKKKNVYLSYMTKA